MKCFLWWICRKIDTIGAITCWQSTYHLPSLFLFLLTMNLEKGWMSTVSCFAVRVTIGADICFKFIFFLGIFAAFCISFLLTLFLPTMNMWQHFYWEWIQKKVECQLFHVLLSESQLRQSVDKFMDDGRMNTKLWQNSNSYIWI